MLSDRHVHFGRQAGVSLLEVLVTVFILAFGILGLAGLQSKIQVGGAESFQRVQATLLASDMAERISANRAQAANYVVTGSVGTNDTQPADCTTLTDPAAFDLCQWSNALKGAGETVGTSNRGTVLAGRGCITQLQTPNPATGVCTPAIYLVTVAWQGMHQTTEPTNTCGKDQYGGSGYRRAVSVQVAVGLPSC
jgi:type IV pilus assembly protein PilV